MTIDVQSRRGAVDHDILDVLAERWSPRAFDESAEISDGELDRLLEAARWAPSAMNAQPYRFVVARRGSTEFGQILTGLTGFNQAWAPRASALVVGIAVTQNEDGRPQRWAEYDLGQAVALLAVQAHADGWHAHQMGGIEPQALREAFDLPESWVPVTVTAIGRVADASILDEGAQQRERAERTRRPLTQTVVTRG